MKKGTEGYVLVYVLVVVVLLSLACTAICGFTLSGVRTQWNALENDRQRYAAEGVVEQAAARLLDEDLGVVKLAGSEFSTSTGARKDLADQYGALITQLADEIDGFTASVENNVWDEEAGTCTFETEITAEQDGRLVSAVLKVVLTVNESSYSVEVGEPDPETGVRPTEPRYQYQVTSAQLSYDDYQVQAAEPEGGGGL